MSTRKESQMPFHLYCDVHSNGQVPDKSICGKMRHRSILEFDISWLYYLHAQIIQHLASVRRTRIFYFARDIANQPIRFLCSLLKVVKSGSYSTDRECEIFMACTKYPSIRARQGLLFREEQIMPSLHTPLLPCTKVDAMEIKRLSWSFCDLRSLHIYSYT